MLSIDHQVAVVTGASRGIGQAIAAELASLGALVVLSARGRSGLEETARRIGSGAVVPADVRSSDQVHGLFEQTLRSIGPVDIVVNAAGLGIFGPVVEFREQDFDALIDTNVKGIFLTCREALPVMIERKRGHIVNIASIAGKVGSANRAAYCASKFAVVGFTQSVAEEVREHGVRVSVVCPGSTDTAFSPGSKSGKPREKMLTVADIAHAVRMVVTQEPRSFISEIVMRPTRKP